MAGERNPSPQAPHEVLWCLVKRLRKVRLISLTLALTSCPTEKADTHPSTHTGGSPVQHPKVLALNMADTHPSTQPLPTATGGSLVQHPKAPALNVVEV